MQENDEDEDITKEALAAYCYKKMLETDDWFCVFIDIAAGTQEFCYPHDNSEEAKELLYSSAQSIMEWEESPLEIDENSRIIDHE